MKILILNWRDIKHQWAGGSEINIHEMSRCLVTKGHAVTILCANHLGAKGINKECIDNINHIRVGGYFSAHLMIPLYYLCGLQHDYDVIIDVELGIPFFILLLTNNHGYCLVNHIHNKTFFTETTFPINIIGAFIETKLMPYLYKKKNFLTISQTTKQELQALGIKKESIQVVYPGLEHTLYKPGNSKFDAPTLIYVGRLRKYKRVNILIEMMPTILKAIPNAKLIIVGDGIERSNLIRLVEQLELENNVEILGYIPDDAKVGLLQKSWAYVIASMVEGWGLGILEANACGTTAIGLDVCGVNEAIQDGISGLIVKDIALMSDVCIEVLRNEALRKRLEYGALKRAAEFHWDRSAVELIKAIDPTKKLYYENCSQH